MSEVNAFPSDLDEQQIIQQAYDSDLQRLRVDAEVTAVVGDIEISSSTSSITIGNPNNGNTLDVNPDGSINVDVILAPTSDTVSIGNKAGTNFLAVNPDGSINVTSTGSSTVSGTVETNLNGLNVWQTSQYSVGTSAVQLAPTPLSVRSSISIKANNTLNSLVYIGDSAAVTTTTGYALFNGDSLQMDLTPDGVVWAISNNPGQLVYVLEIGGS